VIVIDPKLPAADITVVLKAACPALASLIEINPAAIKTCEFVSSVTSLTVGVPMIAAEFDMAFPHNKSVGLTPSDQSPNPDFADLKAPTGFRSFLEMNL
jgi:hypothetical protein